MALVPTDFPSLLAAQGLNVYVQNGWQSRGGNADHRAVVLHHTTSSSSTKPADDAAYCTSGGSNAPLYNVMVDRYGAVWVLARMKSNNAGEISSTARNEVVAGRAN